jgi:NADH dehydrogenase FAD-containing subunit
MAPSARKRQLRVVVIGMGFAGLEAAYQLTRQSATPVQLTLISNDTHFIVGSSQAFLMLGALEKMDIAIPLEAAKVLLPPAQGGPSAIHTVTRVRDHVTFVDWRAQRVSVRGASVSIPYDYLLVGCGAVCSPSVVPGFLGNVYNICSADDNEMLGQALSNVAQTAGPRSRKLIAVGITRLPFRCPVAPSEWAMLIDARLRAHGVREYVDMLFFTPELQMVAVAGAVGNLFLAEVLRSRGISIQCGAMVHEIIDARRWSSRPGVTLTEEEAACITSARASGGKLIRFSLAETPPHVRPGAIETGTWPLISLNKGAESTAEFLALADVIVCTAPLTAPQFAKDSFPSDLPSSDPNFLPTCRVTQATQFPRVFGAGDVTDIILRYRSMQGELVRHPKTGHFAQDMAQRAVQNILADALAGGEFSLPSMQFSSRAADEGASVEIQSASSVEPRADERLVMEVSATSHSSAHMTQTPSVRALEKTGEDSPSSLEPGWWWSGPRTPHIRSGVCAFQTDGLRAVAVRAQYHLTDGPVPTELPKTGEAASSTECSTAVRPGNAASDSSESTGSSWVGLSAVSAKEMDDMSFSFNVPTEAAMEYLLYFWRTYIHRWFSIPPAICPPHLQTYVPSFLATTVETYGNADALEPAHSEGNDRLWDSLKQAIDAEKRSASAGESPTSVLVGPLLASVARHTRINSKTARLLASAIEQNFEVPVGGAVARPRQLEDRAPKRDREDSTESEPKRAK